MPPLLKRELPRDLPLSTQADLVFRPESNPTNHVAFADASEVPFESHADHVSRVNAWWLAEAAWLAYARDMAMVAALLRDRAGLTSCLPIDGAGTHGFVASGDRFAIAAFRGTQSDDPRDLISDLLFAPAASEAGRVHKGFAAALDSVQRPLDAALASLPAGMPVWFTGHSLGAAIATLAAWRHRARAGGICTIGSPLVGSRRFAAAFDAEFGARSLRFVNNHDLVTRLPFPVLAGLVDPYSHILHQRRIAVDGRTHDGDDDASPNGQTPQEMMQVLSLADGLDLPPILADHTPLYYALHAWNDLVDHAP